VHWRGPFVLRVKGHTFLPIAISIFENSHFDLAEKSLVAELHLHLPQLSPLVILTKKGSPVTAAFSEGGP
jgi:hypothetical protein